MERNVLLLSRASHPARAVRTTSPLRKLLDRQAGGQQREALQLCQQQPTWRRQVCSVVLSAGDAEGDAIRVMCAARFWCPSVCVITYSRRMEMMVWIRAGDVRGIVTVSRMPRGYVGTSRR